MTAPAERGPYREASDFADALGATLRVVLPGDVPPISALRRPGRGDEGADRIHVAPRSEPSSMKVAAVPLYVNQKHRLELRIDIDCAWDRPRRFLTVLKSSVRVDTRGQGDRSQPIFRYEYDHDAPDSVPVAHFHVHAHRDQIFALMLLGDTRRPKGRQARAEMPQLSDLHFPVGGHRFRPCIEDVLETVIDEFGIDTRDGWLDAIRDGRADWRRKQLAAAVRDSPEIAAQALRDLKWTAEPPEGYQHREDLRRLTAR